MAVRTGHQPRDPERRRAAIRRGHRLGQRAHRHGAAPAERGQHRPLGAHRAVGRVVVDRPQEGACAFVVSPALHGDRALPGLGQHVHRVEDVGDLVQPTQALHRGHGDDDRGDPAGARGRDAPRHVAPQVAEDQVRPQVGQLRPAPRRARCDQGARRELGQTAPDQGVPRVGPRRHGREDERRPHDRRHVLGRVHGRVRAAVGDRRFDLRHEHALPTDLVEGRRRVPVAAGPHDHRLDVEARVGRPQQRRHRLGLVQRQWRAPGGQAHGATLRGRRGCAAPRPGARPGVSRRSP